MALLSEMLDKAVAEGAKRANNGEWAPVPEGDYTAEIVKVELTKQDYWAAKVGLKIKTGPQEGRWLGKFYKLTADSPGAKFLMQDLGTLNVDLSAGFKSVDFDGEVEELGNYLEMAKGCLAKVRVTHWSDKEGKTRENVWVNGVVMAGEEPVEFNPDEEMPNFD